MTYHWLRVRAQGRSWLDAYDRYRATDPSEGVRVWGAFYGLFGIGSNELVVMLQSETAEPAAALADAGFAIVERHALAPTVRPTSFAPLERAGLYVFRFFDVRNDDVDEIAALSQQAWTSFEDTDAYAAEPQGLFCDAERSTERGVMLLLTWYDGLGSWQTSRKPAPAARENFQRRHALTEGTIAYATRLIGS